MRSLTTLAIASMLAASSIAGAMAQTSIYVYNFNDATSGAAAGTQTAQLFSVDRNNSSNPNGSVLTTSFATTNVANFAGTAVNADGGDASGQALALQGGTGAVTGGTGGNNGGFLQATADLTGFSNINVSYANQATGTGFNSDQFQYSLDGTNFVNFGSTYAPAGSFATAGTGVVESYNLSSIAGLAGDNSAAFRIVFNGASSATGNNRLDNFIISGTPATVTAPVPEASTTVSFGLLLALGLGGFAVAGRRKNAAK